MDAERWELIQSIFHEALLEPPDEQRDFVARACGNDLTLADEVLSLLAEDARGDSLLDRGVAQAADAVLDRPAVGLPTDRFGPYRITRVLGEGGMGVVYLGEREDLGSHAAIKILRDAWLSPARRERFAAEQRALAQLRHPSIAQLYDANTLPDGTPWFVMEYVEGVPLSAYCRARPIAERLVLFRAVCEAVQHAHTHLIIHRDLKPSNILVRQDGVVKLLDFGIAKQLDGARRGAAGPGGDETRTALRLMTPAYAAPEQIRGGAVGVHTDVYSLGVVLYELLAGRLPFDLSNRTPGEAEAILVEGEPEKPSVAAREGAGAMRRAAWADLDVLCLTAMHKDPARRYRTVEALIRDVDHFLKGEPLEARPDTAGYRMGKFIRRRWRPLAATAAVFVSVVALVTFYTVRLASARNAAVAEAARTQRIQNFMLNLFQGGDAVVGPSDSLRVITLVDQGLREAQGLSAEPAVQAELYHTLGDIYRELGNLPRADTVLRAALDQRRALFGTEHPDVAVTLVALGMLRDAQARFDEAEQLVGQGLAMARRTRPAGHPAVAAATAALGQVIDDRGDYTRAQPILEEAVRLYEASAGGAPTPELARSLTELANGQFYLGRFDVSDSLNRITVDIYRKLHGNGHPLVADALLNLGSIQFEQGRFADAERFEREALAIHLAWYGENHPETASNLTLLARAVISQQRLDEAAALLRRSLAIQERVYGPVHPRVASALNELGRVAQQQKRLDEAEAHFRRMTEIYRAVYADRHYVIGIALSNLAGVYHERREFARAVGIFEDVLRRYAEVLPPDHQLVGIARQRLGRALLGQKQYARAERESLAGLEILLKQTTPAPLWVQRAREDLVVAYEALGRREEMERFRRELADTVRPVVAGERK